MLHGRRRLLLAAASATIITVLAIAILTFQKDFADSISAPLANTVSVDQVRALQLEEFANLWPSSPRPDFERLPWLSPGQHPLPIDVLERTFAPPAHSDTWCPWQQVAAALDRNQSISIVVIGGSVTMGHACRVPNERCRWSRHVEDWLRRLRPSWRFTVTNLAAGGMGSYEWANAPIPGPVDVVLVDTSVNAFFFRNESLRGNADRLLWRLLHMSSALAGGGPPAILFVETFRLCGPLGCGACPTHGLKLPEPPSNVSAAPDLHRGIFWCPWFWDMASVEGAVARHYGIALSSYRDAVWPVRDRPPVDLALYWRPGPDTTGLHPDETAHELIAHTVKWGLSRLLLCWSAPAGAAAAGGASKRARAGSCYATPPPAAPLLQSRESSAGDARAHTQGGAPAAAAGSGGGAVCVARPPAAPLTPDVLSTTSCASSPGGRTVGFDDPAAFEAAPLARSGHGWAFASERPGKPLGWLGTLSDGEPPPWIVFPVRFDPPAKAAGKYDPPKHSIYPQFEVTFLRSYEGYVGADAALNMTACHSLPLDAAAVVGAGAGGASEPPLQGWWGGGQRVSTPFTLTWAVSADQGASDRIVDRVAFPQGCTWHLQHVDNGGLYALNITLRRSAAAPQGASRFKILRVSSCGMTNYPELNCC